MSPVKCGTLLNLVPSFFKKINKRCPLPSQQLHQEASVTDLYAVVGKSKILNNSLPSQQLHQESVTERANREIQKTCCKYPVLVASCLTVLITAVVVVAVAVVIALALIAGLHSELDSVIENHKLDHNNFKQKLDLLQTEYYSFSSYTSDLLVGVRQSTSESASNLRQQTNITHGLIRSISLIRRNMQVLNTTFIQKINDMDNTTSIKLQILKREVVESSTAANDNFQRFRDGLDRDIQTFHTFNSCTNVFILSIQLPPGRYMIRSGGSVREEYCMEACNGIRGVWKRIAYLNTDENPVSCPGGFEIRSGTSYPPLCRLMDTSAGCSSVLYPSNGMSYSQVCGTVRVHPAGTPDGFHTFDTKSEEDYVDGVSITYGDSSNRNHILTFTAAVTVESNTRECGICGYNKPIFPGNNFTCTAAHCNDGNNCYPETLWGNEVQQCFGNETFYRQLSEPTTESIEMRVCRDQDQSDEDILVSLVELFVI